MIVADYESLIRKTSFIKEKALATLMLFFVCDLKFSYKYFVRSLTHFKVLLVEES